MLRLQRASCKETAKYYEPSFTNCCFEDLVNSDALGGFDYILGR